MRAIDTISAVLAQVAAWLFVATGAMLTFEVVARYLFNAPTIWAAEISQLFLIIGVFMAIGATINRRENIAIEILQAKLPPYWRRFTDSFALIFIAALAAIVAWWGFDIAWDSFIKNRSTGTMLNLPNWWTEVFVPAGFALVLVQAVVELVRVWTGAGWGPDRPGPGHE